MFLFRFAWWIVAAILRLTFTVGIVVYLAANAGEGLSALESRGGALLETIRGDGDSFFESMEDHAYRILAERRMARERTAEDARLARFGSWDTQRPRPLR